MLNEKDLITNYPCPIVAAYLTAQRSVLGRSASAYDRITSITALAQVIAKYTASLVIAQYCAYRLQDEEMEKLLRGFARAPGKASFDAWVGMLQHGVRAFERLGFENEAIVPITFLEATHKGELLDLYHTILAFVGKPRDTRGKKKRQVSCHHVLEGMVQLDLIAHSSSRLSDNNLAGLDYSELLTGIRALLGEMSSLVQYPLVYIEGMSISNDKKFASVQAKDLLSTMDEQDMSRESEEIISLSRQLANEKKNLLLIQERKTEHVMETDISLDLIKQEQQTQEHIEELEQRIEELKQSRQHAEKVIGGDTSTASLERLQKLHDARAAMGAALTSQEPIEFIHPLDEQRFYILYPERPEPILCLGPLLKYEDGAVLLVPESERDQLRRISGPQRRSLFGLTPQENIDHYAQAVRNALAGKVISASHQRNLDNLAESLGIPAWLTRQIEEEVKANVPAPLEMSQPDSPNVEWEYLLEKPVRKISMGRLSDSPRVWAVIIGEGPSDDSLYLIDGDHPPRLVEKLHSRAETVACSENGAAFAVGCWNGQVSVFDKQGRPRRGPPNLGNVIKAIALSPDGSKLAAATWGEVALLFDLEHSTTLREVQLADAGQSVAIGMSVQTLDTSSLETKATTEARTPLHTQLAKLYENLAHFGEQELRTLCSDLGVDYAALPARETDDVNVKLQVLEAEYKEGAIDIGRYLSLRARYETSKAELERTGKVRELVTRLDQTGRIPEMIEICRKLRPHISWGEILAAPPTVSHPPPNNQPRSAASRQTYRVAAGTYHGWISLFEAGDREPRSEDIGDSVIQLALAEGNKVIAACADGRITSLDSQERRSYRVSGAINDLAISRDGRKIVIAHSGNRLTFLNDTGGQLRPARAREPELDGDIVHVTVSDDGRWCFAITSTGTLYVFEEIRRCAQWSLGKPSTDLAISADARRVVVAFADGSLRLFTLPTTLVPSVEPKIKVHSVSLPELHCTKLSILEIQVYNEGNGVAREVSANITGPVHILHQPGLESLRPKETRKLQYNLRASEPGTLLLEFEITYRDDSGELRSKISYIDDDGVLRVKTRFSKQFEAV